jgi:hypothetical protein
MLRPAARNGTRIYPREEDAVASEGIGIPEPRSGEKNGDGIRSPVHHETPLSETLKDGATAQAEEARRATGPAQPSGGSRGSASRGDERLQEEGSPVKRHGDALADGSGTRHGVDERGRRPDVCDGPAE